MRREWGVLGKAAKTVVAAIDSDGGASPDAAAAAAATTFLATVEFEAAREVFHRLAVDSLPWVVVLPGDHAVGDDGGEVGLPSDAVMRHDAYGAKHWDADDFARFLADRTGGPAIPIARPPKRPSLVGVLSGLTILAALAAAGWKFYNSPLAAWMPLWVAGTLGVWWFATSAGMYNIIRGMPFALPTRDGRVKLFMDGSSGQVGFEGFLMGTLYSSVGLAMAALATVVPRLADAKARRAAGFACVAGAWFAYTRVVSVHDWKTGFTWSQYLI
jgi:oligosaccharyltransferase complex subunit gamma